MKYDYDRNEWVPGYRKNTHRILHQTDYRTNVFIGKFGKK